MSIPVSEKETWFRSNLTKLIDKGHHFLEVIRNRETVVFRCLACRVNFKTNKDLNQHLKEENHATTLKVVNDTLQKDEPWPFNDGMHFFHNAEHCDLIIPKVLHHGQIVNLRTTVVGVGKIMLRKNFEGNAINKIWCEWRAKEQVSDVGENSFGIVTFPWSNTLGRFPNLSEYLDAAILKGGIKTIKAKELKEKMDAVSYSICEICKQDMLPGKDVGVLFNKSSRTLACAFRGFEKGAFHVYHMSCLVSWILLWECEKHDKEGLHPIFCPQCQGTGDGAVYDLNVFAMVERPTQETLYEMRQYKLKLQHAYDAWWESPEIVAKPSIGLRFPEHDSPPPQQGPVSPLCYIKIYKASA